MKLETGNLKLDNHALIKKSWNSKRRTRVSIAAFFVFFMVFTLLLPGPISAVEDETLDEIINNFDDNKSSAFADAIQDVLEGFDDEPENAEKIMTEDDIPKGFDDDAKEAEVQLVKDESKPSVFSFNGDIQLGAAYNFGHHKPEGNGTDQRGLSRLRAELNLELNTRFSSSWQAHISGKGAFDSAYAIKGRDEFTDDVLDNYEKEFELGETYIQGCLADNLDLKFGRQVVVWGKSDNIRVTDVLNPLDMREPGITDIEDLRLPLTMTRLDYYIGDWSLTGIAVHEIRFNKNPEYGSDFYPFSIAPPHEDKPGSGFNNTEYAVSVNGIFSRWDISFFWADYYNDAYHMQLVSFGLPPVVERKHARLQMLGTAFNVATGNWLLKTEAAWIEGFTFFNSPGKQYSRTDILAGLEYAGFTDTTLSIEAVNRHVNGFDEALKLEPDSVQQNEFQWTARASRDYLNDTLTLTLLVSAFGGIGEDGAYQRFSAEYDITDFIQISGGIMLYSSGDLAVFKNIGDNDRLFFNIRYSF